MSGLIRGNGAQAREARTARRHAFGGDRDGFVRNASPAVGLDYLAATPSGGKVLSLGSVLAIADRFVATGDGEQHFTLTYQPISGSEHLLLNGVDLDEPVEWSRAGKSLVINAAADVRAGDVVRARYLYYADNPSGLAAHAISAKASQFPPLLMPSGAQAGDLVIAFIGMPADGSLTLNGYAQLAHTASVTHAVRPSNANSPVTYSLYVLAKTITGPSDLPSASSPGGFSIMTATVLVKGGAPVVDTQTATVGDATSATAPAVASGTAVLRCWVPISNNLTVTDPPPRGSTLAVFQGFDLDIIATLDTDPAAAAENVTGGTAGWLCGSVSIG